MTYTALEISSLDGPQRIWGNNEGYTLPGFANTPCENGIFLQPSVSSATVEALTVEGIGAGEITFAVPTQQVSVESACFKGQPLVVEQTRTLPLCYDDTAPGMMIRAMSSGSQYRYILKSSTELLPSNDVDSCKQFCNSIASDEYIGLQYHQDEGCQCLFSNGALPIYPDANLLTERSDSSVADEYGICVFIIQGQWDERIRSAGFTYHPPAGYFGFRLNQDRFRELGMYCQSGLLSVTLPPTVESVIHGICTL